MHSRGSVSGGPYPSHPEGIPLRSLKTVLVIDDEKDVVGCIEDSLMKDFRVLTAFDGQSGMDFIEEELVSLIVLDYCLPDMDGIEILKAVRQGPHIPVIMITAHGDKDLVLRSWRYRADYYFDKPLVFADLRKKVQELLMDDDEKELSEVLNCNISALSPQIRKTLKYIKSIIADPSSEELTLSEIATRVNLSPRQLSRLFKQEVGQTVYQSIVRLKIQKAHELMRSGKNIKETSITLGFAHSNNFCKFIKKFTGISPSDLNKSDY